MRKFSHWSAASPAGIDCTVICIQKGGSCYCVGIWSTCTGSALITDVTCDSRVMVWASGWVLLFAALWAWWPMGGSQIAKIPSASHCTYIFNNHETVRSWEWVTAVAALPLVKSWRALWWKCCFCSTFSTVKNKQWILHNACLWVFTPHSPYAEDIFPFNTFFSILNGGAVLFREEAK